MTFEFHPEAEVEFIEAVAYYERQVPGLGKRFQSEIRGSVDLLVSQPQIGASVDPYLRKFILTRFPFALYYSITADVLRVEAVAHHTRRPGYWKERIVR